jgi:hypothetical protein
MCSIDWNLLLEYLKVLLTIPTLASLVLIIFICTFKQELKNLINRIASIKFPGGAEVNTPQPSKEISNPSVSISKVQLSDTLPSGLTESQETAITQLVKSHIANSYLWEYRYLNYFLVRKTQLVLDWLTNFNQPVTANLYDSVWIPSIHNANERQIILDVLQAHHLIQIDQLGMIGLTAKGKEYIEWRGVLPELTT